ncbi:MAG TPA: MFS transporter [Chitinophagales bacterium]|nr:MFS transporter [Chitinophagales bacterium]
MSRKEYLLVITMALAQFANIMDFMIMMPLGPQFMQIFSITPRQFGLLVSSYSITAGLTGFVCSFFLDRWDRKRSLVATFAGFVIGTFCCAISSGYRVLLLARIITGIFGGILGAQILAIVGDVFPYERRAYAMGVVTASFSLASVLGVPVGLYLAAEFSWHMPFFSIAAFGIVVFVLLIRFVPPIKAHLEQQAGRHPLALLRGIGNNRNQQFALLFMFLLILGQFTIIPFIAAYMEFNVGFTDHQLSFIYLFGGAATFISSPLIGKLADRIGKPKVFLIAAVLSIIPLFLITNLPRVPLAFALTITSFFFILIMGRMTPAMTMITGTVSPDRRGSYMSIVTCVQMLTAGVAAYVSGLMVEQLPSKELIHYNYAGYLAIGSTVLAILASRKLVVAEGNLSAEPVDVTTHEVGA